MKSWVREEESLNNVNIWKSSAKPIPPKCPFYFHFFMYTLFRSFWWQHWGTPIKRSRTQSWSEVRSMQVCGHLFDERTRGPCLPSSSPVVAVAFRRWRVGEGTPGSEMVKLAYHLLTTVFPRLDSSRYDCLLDASISRAYKNDASNPKKKQKQLQHLKRVKPLWYT